MSASNAKVSRIAVLSGGDSAEREISLQSGAAVAAAARAAGLAVVEVDTKNEGWTAQLDAVDLAFIALHGPGGEDGALQGALQTLGVPYSGAGVLGSALAMDKQRSKELWQGIGVSTPGFTMLEAGTDWQSVIDRFGTVFVKPAREGSSIGMSRVDTAQGLAEAFALASVHGDDVLAEQWVQGPEYTVGILGDETLPAIRLETDNTFYDYQAKYLSDDTRYHCPAGLDAPDEAALSALAWRAFASLDCAVWGRVDVMRGADGTFYVLEVNTVPGMTSHSLVPMAAAAVGMDMSALVLRIVELSLAQERCR